MARFHRETKNKNRFEGAAWQTDGQTDGQTEWLTTAMICCSERPNSTSTASLSLFTGRASFWYLRTSKISSISRSSWRPPITSVTDRCTPIRVPAYWLGLSRGAFTCVGWQVTLRDPVWQVASRSCEIGVLPSPINSYTLVLFRWRFGPWLSGNTLVSINKVVLRRARLLPGWMTAKPLGT